MSVVQVTFACQIMLWLVKPSSCWSVVFSYLGLAPMQVRESSGCPVSAVSSPAWHICADAACCVVPKHCYMLVPAVNCDTIQSCSYICTSDASPVGMRSGAAGSHMIDMCAVLGAQIVVTVLVWENCWYFMPSAATDEPILQVCAPADAPQELDKLVDRRS